MDQPKPPSRTTPPTGEAPAGVRRRRWVGSTIAVVTLVAIAALAWYLTHRPQPVPNAAGAAAAGARGGPGGPLGASGRGAPPSTVGVGDVATRGHAGDHRSARHRHAGGDGDRTPQVSGVITQVLFTEGQMVKKGQLLATIDPRPFESGAAAGDRRAPARRGPARQRRACSCSATRRCSSRTRSRARTSTRRRRWSSSSRHRRASTAPTKTRRGSTCGYGRGSSRRSPGGSACAPIDAGNYIARATPTASRRSRRWRRSTSQFSVPQDRVPEMQGAHRRRRAAAGDGVRPHAHAAARRRHVSRRSTTRSTRRPARSRRRRASRTPAARCSRTSSSTCDCCCARSTARSSCRSPRCGTARTAISSTSSTPTARCRCGT